MQGVLSDLFLFLMLLLVIKTSFPVTDRVLKFNIYGYKMRFLEILISDLNMRISTLFNCIFEMDCFRYVSYMQASTVVLQFLLREGFWPCNYSQVPVS